jgi:dipeptidyl-peptidase-4
MYMNQVHANWQVSPNGGPTIAVQNRYQTEMVLLSVNPTTGRTTPLLVERDTKWINLDQSTPRWLSSGRLRDVT